DSRTSHMTCAKGWVVGATLALALLLATPVPSHAQAAKPEVHLAALTPAIEVDADLMLRVQSVSAPADAQLRITTYARTRTRSGSHRRPATLRRSTCRWLRGSAVRPCSSPTAPSPLTARCEPASWSAPACSPAIPGCPTPLR